MSSLDQKVGQQVTIAGKAANASMGAIVETESLPVYLDGVERWHRDVHGKQVKVTGTLRKISSGPLVNDKGEYSHGVPGDRFVIEKPTWTVS